MIKKIFVILEIIKFLKEFPAFLEKGIVYRQKGGSLIG